MQPPRPFLVLADRPVSTDTLAELEASSGSDGEGLLVAWSTASDDAAWTVGLGIPAIRFADDANGVLRLLDVAEIVREHGGATLVGTSPRTTRILRLARLTGFRLGGRPRILPDRPSPGAATTQDEKASAPSIRPLDEHELDLSAAVHARAFSDSILGKLGIGTVRRYYREILRSNPDSGILGAFVDGDVGGFIVCHPSDQSLGRFMVRHAPSLVLRSLVRLPTVARQLSAAKVRAAVTVVIGRLRRLVARGSAGAPTPAPTPSPSEDSPRVFKLLSMGVDPLYRRRGLARALIPAGQDRGRERGYDRCRFSVAEDNHNARRLYDDVGFLVVEVRGSEVKMEIDLHDASASSGE